MKHRPFSELTKHWPPERTAKIEARVATALAELDRQERERTADEKLSPGGYGEGSASVAGTGSLTTGGVSSHHRRNAITPGRDPRQDRPPSRPSAATAAS